MQAHYESSDVFFGVRIFRFKGVFQLHQSLVSLFNGFSNHPPRGLEKPICLINSYTTALQLTSNLGGLTVFNLIYVLQFLELPLKVVPKIL